MKKLIIILIAVMLFPFGINVNAIEGQNVLYVCKPQYDEIGLFENGCAIVKCEGEYEIIDSTNNILTQNNYELLEYCDNGIYHAKDSEKSNFTYMNSREETIVELDGKYIGGVCVENKFKIYENTYGSEGIMDINGNIILYPEYDYILLSEKSAYLKKDNIWYLMEYSNGNIRIVEYNIINKLGEYVIISNEDNKIGLIDFNGNIVVDYKYRKIEHHSDNYYYAYYGDNFDILNEYGKIIATYPVDMYTHITEISNDMICVNNIYYNLKNNQQIILPENAKGEPFYENYAVVSFYPQVGGETYINEDGTLATIRSWDKAYRFANGYALVMDYIYNREANTRTERWCIINSNFETVKQLDYDVYKDNSIDHSFDFSKGYIRTIDRNTGKMGYIYLKDYSGSDKYDIYFKFIDNETDLWKIVSGSIIELPECTFTREGYTFSHWTDGTANYNPGDTFIMPDHDVTMTAVWKKNVPVEDDKPETDNDKPSFNWFPIINQIQNKKSETEKDNTTVSPEPDKYVCSYKDISGHWAEDIIQFIDELGLIDGITSTQFQPNEPMSREMFVTAVARLAGVESDYVSWAINNGILLGYGNGEYGLTDTVTREQMAVFFLRYFEKMGIDVDDFRITASYTFADDENISDWASGAVYEIQSLGLIKGKGNNIFDPQGTTTRAEAATVLYNLIQTVLAKIN